MQQDALHSKRNMQKSITLFSENFNSSFEYSSESQLLANITAEQTKLVKNSWKKLRHVNAEIIGDLFYSKLFVDEPRLRKMFSSQMKQQNKKLIDMLSFIVSKIDNFQSVNRDIQALAIRHECYGVKPEHYEMIGTALIWTLEKAVGKDWNINLKQAWIACFNTIAKTMIAATKKPV